jgi:hypothetical protein
MTNYAYTPGPGKHGTDTHAGVLYLAVKLGAQIEDDENILNVSALTLDEE